MSKTTFKNAMRILRKDGVRAFVARAKVHRQWVKHNKKYKGKIYTFKDVLFINGCPIDYCERYRVLHKMEELAAYGVSCDETVPELLTEETIKYYRCFIIYRTPWSEHVDTFVKLAKQSNKVVMYDIDDLVFDLKFTKTIKELKTFTKEQLDLYNDGVIRYGKMMDCCDYAITTTSVIAKEMKKHVKDVCVDKNVASLTMQKYSELAIEDVKKNKDKVVIGYASGSITHNADFEMISPALMRILDENENVVLKLIGVINVPKEYQKYGSRVQTSPFVDFKKLPYVLRSLDINLAPLENTFFNTAKSSIKWMEAGFVKVPTVASDVGNFHDCITDGVDGILCKDNEWYDKLTKLINDPDYRETIANNAYNTVYSKFTTVTSGRTIADFIVSKLTKKICFVIPSSNISGGIMVATKHGVILKKAGYDVCMLNTDPNTTDTQRLYDNIDFVDVISIPKTTLDSKVDLMVSTMWFTVFDALRYEKHNRIKYLVQNMEHGFYKPDDYSIVVANSTYYNDSIEYITISKWCQDWLKNDYNKESLYAPNGIDLKKFPYKKRKFKGKIKILIEGDPAVHYKNVDEAFRITNLLDKSKYEIHFLSYNAKPKEWYKVDVFHHKVPHNDVYKVYQECDILLKSSLLESFSYPPLEMMATGGVCVVVPNGGNIEYLKDDYN